MFFSDCQYISKSLFCLFVKNNGLCSIGSKNLPFCNDRSMRISHKAPSNIKTDAGMRKSKRSLRRDQEKRRKTS